MENQFTLSCLNDGFYDQLAPTVSSKYSCDVNNMICTIKHATENLPYNKKGMLSSQSKCFARYGICDEEGQLLRCGLCPLQFPVTDREKKLDIRIKIKAYCKGNNYLKYHEYSIIMCLEKIYFMT